jgi:hypothetical protein
MSVLQIMRGDPPGPALLESVDIDDAQLVWDSDREDFFSDEPPVRLNILPDLRGGRMLDPNVPINQDEHFMHWMRPAAHPSTPWFPVPQHQRLSGMSVAGFAMNRCPCAQVRLLAV